MAAYMWNGLQPVTSFTLIPNPKVADTEANPNPNPNPSPSPSPPALAPSAPAIPNFAGAHVTQGVVDAWLPLSRAPVAREVRVDGYVCAMFVPVCSCLSLFDSVKLCPCLGQ